MYNLKIWINVIVDSTKPDKYSEYIYNLLYII